MSAEEPAEKKQKTEEEETKDEEMKGEEAAVEEVKELEQDAKKDTGAKIKETAAFLIEDTTLNVLPASVGNMLMTLSDGAGMQYLMAGARGNVGVKSGRYMFEAKIVEQMNPWEDNGKKSQSVGKHAFRLGFAVGGGSLFLGEDEDGICFDNEGCLISNKKKTKCSQPFGREDMVAVVLNLEKGHDNCNTVSLFKNGNRVSPPQALPEALQGKTLFPVVSFKNSTVHVNFSQPCTPLPFKCKVLQEASTKEAEVKTAKPPQDGKYKVLFPISIPDEGTFNWLDMFLEKNPDYAEISDRSIVHWAEKSGMLKMKAKRTSNDRPEINFGASVDDLPTIKRILYQVASVQPRNFVVMEVQSNLIKEHRLANLTKFKSPLFKTVAEIVVGEPPADFVKVALKKRLELKQEAANNAHILKQMEEKRQWNIRRAKKDAERKKKKEEKARMKALEAMKKKQAKAEKKRQREAEKAAKKVFEDAEKQRKEQEEAAKKAEEAAKKAAEGAEGGAAEGEEKKEGEDAEKKEEEQTEEKQEEEKKEEEEQSEEEEEEKKEEPESEQSEDEAEPMEEDAPKVTLDDEEKKLKFFPNEAPDLSQYALNTTFMKFSLPESDEGFDEVKSEWAKAPAAATALKDWVLQRKLTTRVEDIRPSDWFKQKEASWKQAYAGFMKQRDTYTAKVQAKAKEKAQKTARKAQAERNAKLAADKKVQDEKDAAEKKEQEALAKATAKAAAEEQRATAKTAAEEKLAVAKVNAEAAGEDEAAKTAAEEAAKAAEEELAEIQKQEEAEAAKEAEEVAKEAEEAAKKAEEEEKAEEKKEEEAAPMEVEEEEEEEELPDFAGVDVFGVEDISNIGAGMPLCQAFAYEDQMLLELRGQLHLLVHAFRKDVNDAEREGIHLDHLGFYFNRYFQKNLNFKQFGVSTAKELVDLVNDTVYIAKNGTLVPWLPDELESHNVFVKLTEEARRHRNIQIDMGEESAKLKIDRHFDRPEGKGQKRGWDGQMVPPPDWGKGKDMGKKGFDKGWGKDAGKDMGKMMGDKGMGKMDMGKGDMGKMGKDMGKMDGGKGKMVPPMNWGMDKGAGKDGDKGWGADPNKGFNKGFDKGFGKGKDDMKGGDKGKGKDDMKGGGKGDDAGKGKDGDKGWGKW